ncbi:hypothetical protein DAPPUDRAFT_324796 [Daphnia pulex]|uniref:Uncharacterized protein n=1 Tax=Daphnia pulex TaxID=6669 RepID=E9H2Q9_DAPPU|nr:hypothetical protein DAPPUDRAFT_324796 [Daphnia pulex]|eukprot:EFX74017.1 hypothetical protein DAPPUDRAFT_324796 [Daphnia pulex]
MTLTEISAEWISCEEVDAVDNGNSPELVSASMESVCSHNISEATKEFAANQWSSSNENGEQYFDIEIMSSTDEDHSDGKNKSENVTSVQRVRQRVTSAIKKIDSKHLRRGKPEVFGNTLTCEILQLTNDAECDKERDVSNFENGSFGKDIRYNSNQIDKGNKIGSARNDKEILELHNNAMPNHDKSKDEIGSELLGICDFTGGYVEFSDESIPNRRLWQNIGPPEG